MTAIVFLTVLLGTGAITSLINVIPENILNGLGKAGEMLTAVGFGMLLNILWDKRFIGLYFVGFAVAAFLNLNVIAITIIATGLGFVAMYASKDEKGDCLLYTSYCFRLTITSRWDRRRLWMRNISS